VVLDLTQDRTARNDRESLLKIKIFEALLQKALNNAVYLNFLIL